MRLSLNKLILLFVLFFASTSYSNSFNAEYRVSTTGIKIGYFDWSLKINDNSYKTKINLKNSGIFSPIYKFDGSYLSIGVIENGLFKTREYKQFWKTKKKTKIVNMLFDDYLIKLTQKPIEKEFARINLEKLYLYFDPITSFINILSGKDDAMTIDGRRIYTLKKDGGESKKIVLKVEDYQNIWADHKRNDLKKIEFFIEDDFLPYKIFIYFKERIFKLEKI